MAVGLGGIVSRSTDGGSSWTAPTSIAPFDLLDVEFFDALNGLAVGANGYVIRTTDGGMTWGTPISATGANLYGLAFADRTVLAVPEPATHLLFSLGLLACWAAGRRASRERRSSRRSG